MMRLGLALVVLVFGLCGTVADAQTVFTRQGGRVIAVPLADLPTTPTSTPVLAEGGTVRVDGLPAGAQVAVDGRALGGPGGLAGGWIVLPPGPHFIDVTLPGGQAIRFTVVTPTESSGYQVVPKP
jgi:hypothetical protein